MIADLLPRYQECIEKDGHYDILHSIVIDGHEVAWMSYAGTIKVDTMGLNREGQTYVSRRMYCECDFEEGVWWKLDENGQVYNFGNQNRCLKRQAALHLRHLELRQEYFQRFVEGNPSKILGLESCIREVTLDLIEKSKAGEWLEDGNGAEFYGGHFYLQTVATITDKYIGHIWGDIHKLVDEKLISLEGAIVKEYAERSPVWEEFVRFEDYGYVGVASLPGHRQMDQVWKLQVFNSTGDEILPAAIMGLDHDPLFGPDIEDLSRVRVRLTRLMSQARRQK